MPVSYSYKILLFLQGFEHASQPGMTEKEQMRLLHFAVVGGGPTVDNFLCHIIIRA